MSRDIGQRGEAVAVDFLTQKKWRILEQNFYSKYGEIDIVASDLDGTLVFCEVKTYKPGSMVSPIEAVTPQKVNKIRKTASYYLAKYQVEETPARLDLLVVREGMVVDHLENIA